jgi:branched-chain amino acid transport system ATP-binding protein
MALLELREISKHFGGLAAVSKLEMAINPGDILGLIGPNGAGKTTTFNVITGDYPPTSGQVVFEGKDITGTPPHEVAKMGIVRTFQLTALFGSLSVLQNVLVGLHLHSTIGVLGAILNTRSNRGKETALTEQAMEVLDFMDLTRMKDDIAGNLPHGLQRALGIAVALAAMPKLLLLDEPLTGMNPVEAMDMIETIRRIRERRGTTVVVVEHNMQAVMALCERIVVISFGNKIAEGTPEEIQTNTDVIEAYLGSEEGAA